MGAGSTLPTRPIRIDERILHYLTGIDAIDERLDGIAFIGTGPVPLVPSQVALAMDVARTAATGDPTLVLLDSQDVDGRLDVAFRIAAELGFVPSSSGRSVSRRVWSWPGSSGSSIGRSRCLARCRSSTSATIWTAAWPE